MANLERDKCYLYFAVLVFGFDYDASLVLLARKKRQRLRYPHRVDKALMALSVKQSKTELSTIKKDRIKFERQVGGGEGELMTSRLRHDNYHYEVRAAERTIHSTPYFSEVLPIVTSSS